MGVFVILFTSLISATSVTIAEPVDGETYDGDWLTIRAIVENENEAPDSVHYELNGSEAILVLRLNTDWYTYMQNDLHHGYSESPAPTNNTVLWTAQVTGDFHEFPTPVVVDGIVYYPSNMGTDSLYALDAASGDLLWKYLVGETDDAVTVKDGYLYTASDSLWCLDAITGERIWATDYANSGGSTPAVHGGCVYAGKNLGRPGTDLYTSQVVSLDAYTGSVNWVISLPEGPAMLSCMTIWDDLLFVPTWSNGAEAFLYALDASNGDIVWQNNDSWEGYWDSSPVIVDSILYISGWDGKTRGIDALTGLSIWEREISAGTYISATPAYHDERLYFADQVDTYHCLCAETGDPVWAVLGTQHGSSGIADGIVFYGEDFNSSGARVFALDCETGAEVWSYTTGAGSIFSSPAITDGVVYIAGNDWNLYAFGTGLKYTYLDDLFAEVGSNELIVTSYDGGTAVAADTVNFTVTQQGVTVDPANRLGLSVSPNPSRATASISFNLGGPSMTSVAIYDLAGRVVRVLGEATMSAGRHELIWDGRNDTGERVSSGLYICRISTPDATETTGVCLLR